MFVITEYTVIDFWLKLNLNFTKKNKSKVFENFLCQLFTDSGLELLEFNSRAYNIIKHRCTRIVDKIKDNKRNKQSQYYHGYIGIR